MRRNLGFAIAALASLAACGEHIEFRSDDGTPQRITVPKRVMEGDAHEAPAPVASAETEFPDSIPPEVETMPEPEAETLPPDPPAATPVPPAPTPVPPPPPANEPETCRGITRDVKVLVLDFKSGWFAGDGGEFFRHVVDARCGGKVQVVYAHLTKVIVEGNIWDVPEGKTLLPCIANRNSPRFITDDCRMGSLSGFDAVWVLSGSHADPDDLNSTQPFFASVVSRMVELKTAKPLAGFFFGAGLGNVSHANVAVATVAPGLGALFAPSPETAQGVLPSPSDYVKFASKPLLSGNGSAGSFSADTPFLQGLGSLFDYAPVDHTDRLAGMKLGKCFSDPIVSTAVNVVAHDHCGRATIGHAATAGHRIVVEANMARFYGTGGIDYFDRILRFQLEDRP